MASNNKNLAELLNTDTTVNAGDVADGSVTEAKIADDAVTDAKIASGITASKLSGALPAIDGSSLTGVDPADGSVTTAKLDDGAVTAAKLFSGFANGITEVDTWRLTTSITIGSSGQVDLTTSNIEQPDTYSHGFIGTGMSYSSGIFSFPSTGIWKVEGFSAINANGSTTNYAGINISVTTDNSSYTIPVANQLDHYTNSSGYIQTYTSYIFDVTNISTHKVKFVLESTSTVALFLGSTTKNNTHFRFTKLGDT